MMTASTLFLRSAIGRAADGDRAVGVVATCLIDPIRKISPRARKTDPFPRDHSAISTVEWVCEIAFPGVCQKLGEEDDRRHRRKGGFALLHGGKKQILVGGRELVEVF